MTESAVANSRQVAGEYIGHFGTRSPDARRRSYAYLTVFCVLLAAVMIVSWPRSAPVARFAINDRPLASDSARIGMGDWLRITPLPRGSRVRYLVQFTVQGHVLVGVVRGASAAIGDVRADSELTVSPMAGLHVVRSTFVATDTTTSLLVRAASAPAVITALRVRELKRTPLQPWSDGRALLCAAVVALGTLLILLTHRDRARSQTMIIALAVAILLISTPLFAVALFGLLVGLYWIGRRMQTARGSARRALLLTSVVAIAGVIGGWKYSYPLFGAAFTRSLGSLALAIGVLFFMLRLIDAELRWYRGEQADVSLREFIAFAVFPATLIAGPLETLRGFRDKRLERITRHDVASGLGRMLRGLAKKIVIGDFFLYGLLYGDHYALYDRAVLQGGGRVTVEMLAIAFLFAANDISAYADLAIGLARIHGYIIREDSNWPILASSVRDFWRRWHISVMEWCMANVYFPLVVATRSTVTAIFVTMITMGMWHELSWPWLLWAVHFTIGLTLANEVRARLAATTMGWERARRVATRVFVLWFVVAAHAFVQTDDVHVALRLYRDFWLAPWRH